MSPTSLSASLSAALSAPSSAAAQKVSVVTPLGKESVRYGRRRLRACVASSMILGEIQREDLVSPSSAASASLRGGAC